MSKNIPMGKHVRNDGVGLPAINRRRSKAFRTSGQQSIDNTQSFNTGAPRKWNMPGKGTKMIDSSGDFNRYSRINYARNSPKKHALRNIALCLAFFLILFAGFMGITTKLAIDETNIIKREVTTLSRELISGDTSQAKQAADTLSKTASTMRLLTNNPVWTIASLLPIIGSNVTTVQALSVAFSDLSDSLLVPLTANLVEANAGPFIRKDGSFNIQSLQTAFDALTINTQAINQHKDRIDSLKPNIKQLKTLNEKAAKAFDGLNALAQASPEFSTAIPFLLGSDGAERSFLIIAQNNAEVHASGGFVAHYGFLSVSNGTINISEFHSIWNLGRYGSRDNLYTGEPEITTEEEQLFGRRLSMTPGDTTYTPEFPRAAALLQNQLQNLQGYTIDGVISVDPIFLQAILAVTGEITTSDGRVIDGNNTASLLLHDAYWLYDADAQDAFFAEVASLAFDKLFNNFQSANTTKLAKAIWEASGQRNLLLWFDNTDAQTAMEKMGYSGTVAHDTTKPTLGVYLNNGAGSKMSWFISEKTTLEEEQHNSDGSVVYRAETIITNNLSADQVDAQPNYVLASAFSDRPGYCRHWVYLFAPLGGTITQLEATTTGNFYARETSSYYPTGGKTMIETSYKGLNVWYNAVDLGPGENLMLTYFVTVPAGSQNKLSIDHSPTSQTVAGW